VKAKQGTAAARLAHRIMREVHAQNLQTTRVSSLYTEDEGLPVRGSVQQKSAGSQVQTHMRKCLEQKSGIQKWRTLDRLNFVSSLPILSFVAFPSLEDRPRLDIGQQNSTTATSSMINNADNIGLTSAGLIMTELETDYHDLLSIYKARLHYPGGFSKITGDRIGHVNKKIEQIPEYSI